MPGDTLGRAPGEHGVRGELRAVVRDDRPRPATPHHERRQFADDALAADLCRKYGMSEATLYNWKAKYGGLDVSEAKRLKARDAVKSRR